MQRVLQHLVGIIAMVLILATSFLRPAQADKAVTYPLVEKHSHTSYTETIPGTKVKFEMIAVPGGTYMQGSPATEKGRNADEGPQHPVTVKGFWIGKCEVTWDEFDAYWRGRPGQKEDKEPENPKDADAVTRPTPAYADETFGLGREGNPLICISWHTCMQYCRWLSVKTGKTYRLPTEAEWEWAARAGTNTAYFFGEDPKDLGEYAWYSENSEDTPHPVGKKKPNPWGIHDIYGNVAEFCLDLYDKDYYSKFSLDKPTLQPVNKPAGQRWSHPTRGGGWDSPAAGCRSAARRPSTKDWINLDPQRPQSIWWLTSAEFVGFRIMRPIEEQENLKGFRSLVTRESK